MKIKFFFIIIIISLSVNLRSQSYTSLYDRIIKVHSASKGGEMVQFSMNYDFDNDGVNEVLKGIMLKKINDNTFWVKDAVVVNSESM